MINQVENKESLMTFIKNTTNIPYELFHQAHKFN